MNYENDYNYGPFAECNIDAAEVAETVHWYEGENDGESWMFVLRMKDGRWVYGEAWCDYTGWGCQAGGEAFYADTEEELAKSAMTLRARREFGYGRDGHLSDWL